MIQTIRNFFKCDISEESREDEFVWALAEALLWRDDNGSFGGIALPIKKQKDKNRYYDDALYLIRVVTGKFNEKEEV